MPISWRMRAPGKNVDVVYLDFAKVFDKVDNGVLLHKLRKMGITGKLGIWLHKFLHDRNQAVVVEGTLSKGTGVISGVPQGSVLGPLLFLTMIGDIDQNAKASRVTSFADDTRISRQITREEDAEELQKDLEGIYKWSWENNMVFNKKEI